MPDGSRSARWRGLVEIAGGRLLARLTRTERQQALIAIGGVALSIALLLVVTSVGLGMLAQSTVASEKTDVWIVPEGAASSAVTDVRTQRLGRVHAATGRIERRDGVVYATPVLMSVVQATPSTADRNGSASGEAAGDPSTLVVLGMIPSDEQERLVGLPTSPLTVGDPYYAGGAYDGPWTGEAVLSTGAARALGVSRGDSFSVEPRGGNASRASFEFSAVAVSETRQTGIGQLPVAIVHLSELQRLTGATATDSADQILVAASGSGVQDRLEGIYPGTEVVTRRGLLLHRAGRSDLPVAISVAALLVAVVVGTLFLGTTMGMEIAAGSRQRAVLAALGFSIRSRVAIVGLQALAVALLGGLAGVVIAGLGVAATNLVVTTILTGAPVGVFRPVFVPYGLGVAVLIGVLSLPYLLVVGWRSATPEVLVR